MSSVARTRCCTCEHLALVLAALLCLRPAGAAELRPALVAGGGYLDNPFFDDDTQRGQSPVAGPVGFVEPSVELVLAPGQLQLSTLLGGRFTRYLGAADATAHHVAASAHALWPRGSVVTGALSLSGGIDGVDRFPEDARQVGEVEAAAGWRMSPRTYLRLGLATGARRYGERTLASGATQTDTLVEGTLGLSAGPLGGPILHRLATEVGLWQVSSNGPDLDRQGAQLAVRWQGEQGRWQGRAALTGWQETFASRIGRGISTRLGVGRALAPEVVLAVEAQGVAGDSDQPEGRYQQWGALAQIEVALEVPVATAPPADEPGVARLPDGRWRFVLRLPEARRVDWVGDANHWQVGHDPFARIAGTDCWVAILALPRLQQTWMVVVDGTRFVTPPFGPTRDDGFGRQVGLLRMPQEVRP